MHHFSLPLKTFAAGTVSVLLLAGCPNAGTAPSLPGSEKYPSPGASASVSAASSTAPAAASAAPSAAATTGASAAPTAKPSAKPTAVATVNPAPTGEKTILQGKVYDEAGATVEGAEIALKSLDTRVPFSATATTAGGNYVVNDVPVGVQLEMTVSKAGWTRRVRVTSLQAKVTQRNTMDFGSPLSGASADDPAGAAHFISNYPEIVSATPGSSPIDPENLVYKVRFSEALDKDNQALVEDALQIDTAAAPTDLIPVGPFTATEKSARIKIEEGSSFLDGSKKVVFTWNAEGTELTLTFNAALRALGDDDKSYRVQFIRDAGDDEIKDADGNILGAIATATGASYTAVKKADLIISSTDNTGDLRWQATHQKSSSFEIKEDKVDPVIKAVATSKIKRADRNNTEFYQFELTFSEPMHVYPDAMGYDDSLAEPSNYTFAISDDELDGVDLEDAVAINFNAEASSATDFQNNVADPTAAIKFTETADATDSVFIEPSEVDSKAINFFVPSSIIPGGMKYIKVKVDTAVKDPAGNGVSEKNKKASDLTADNIFLGNF